MKLCLATVVFGALALAAAPQHKPATRQNTTKSFVKTLGSYKVEILESRRKPGRAASWGEFDEPQTTDWFVQDLSIRYQGASVSVPLSCYGDLANVDEMKIVPIKSGLVIKIEGGDASVGYDAQIVVRGDHVAERSVHLGEFPENFWEKTQYHDEPVND